MKKILVFLFLCCFLVGCGNDKATTKLETNKEIKEIMKNGNYQIVDVRTKEEYQEAHVKGAMNIPVDEIMENLDLLDKAKTIFVYCKSGNRSNMAYNTLKGLGYTVYDLGAFSSIDLPKE